MKKLFMIIALLLSFNSFAANMFTESEMQSGHKVLTDTVVSPSDFFTHENNNFQKVNFSCGLPPLPPLNCTVGACMCDQNGQNCRWTFNCR